MEAVLNYMVEIIGATVLVFFILRATVAYKSFNNVLDSVYKCAGLDEIAYMLPKIEMAVIRKSLFFFWKPSSRITEEVFIELLAEAKFVRGRKKKTSLKAKEDEIYE